MEQFARLGDPAALESARRHLRNTDPNVRRAAIRLIYTNRLAAHYDDLLKSAVRDDSADVRREAAEALARVADREMLDDLIGHMRSTSDTVRRNAIVASLVVEDAEVFAELLKHIGDDDETVRLAVIEGIRRTGFRKAAGDLQEVALEDGDDDVRLAAARTLAEVHRPGDSLETLTDALDDRRESVRARAAEALTICGDPAAIPHLIKGLYITAPRPGGDRTPVIGDQRHLIDPVERSPLLGYRVNEAAQVALVEFAKVNFEYSKRKWSRWWKVNGKGLLEDYARRKAKKE
jgi:HEAT repeat protein